MKRTMIVLTLTLVLVGCSKMLGRKDSGPAEGATTTTAGPVKESAVRVLQDALAALEARDYAKAATFFRVPPSSDLEDVKKQLARLLELRELSQNGIDILARDGKWGKLDQAFSADRAKYMAERAGVPLDACYGLSLRNAEAGFYWDGKQFKIIRCDDIGKLG